MPILDTVSLLIVLYEFFLESRLQKAEDGTPSSFDPVCKCRKMNIIPLRLAVSNDQFNFSKCRSEPSAFFRPDTVIRAITCCTLVNLVRTASQFRADTVQSRGKDDHFDLFHFQRP